jgi:hypothetical protein
VAHTSSIAVQQIRWLFHRVPSAASLRRHRYEGVNVKIYLVDVAKSGAYLLAGLAETDGWAEVRMRICEIFGDVEGGDICDASEVASRTGKLSSVRQQILNQLMTRRESTFELRALMSELTLRPVGEAMALGQPR